MYGLFRMNKNLQKHLMNYGVRWFSFSRDKFYKFFSKYCLVHCTSMKFAKEIKETDSLHHIYFRKPVTMATI